MKSLTLIFILIFGLSVFGQTKRQSIRSPIPAYQTTPFNSDIDNLPPKFWGHNAHTLLPAFFNFALEIISKCGKFETSKDCQTRLNGIYDRRISPNLTAKDLLAFSIPVDCNYSADSETIRCSNFLENYTWSHKLVSSGNYIGENAFGVKKLVQYKKFENIYIEIDKTKPDFELPHFPPTEARRVLPNLRLLIVGEPLQPFVKTEPVSYKPTINDPEHIEGNNYSLILETKEVWLYDFESGKILRKEQFTQKQ